MIPIDPSAAAATAEASGLINFHFSNTYAALPERFHARLQPKPVAAPALVKLNSSLALRLGLDPIELATPAGVEILAGNRIAPGSQPLGQAYAGHQFGHFVPLLGDGRTSLLGEIVAPAAGGVPGQRFDVQLKGSGPTPYSRRGDGRAALGPVLREYVLSESMAALGIPTTRALAAVTTGERVVRDTVQPGAIFTRVAASHLRVGTFQYFAAKRDTDGLRILADYALARHYPEAAHVARPYRMLLDSVITRQASLIAQWMLVGFVHGVMNTDNTSISGETIDFGPCAFLEAYEPRKTFSSIDSQGRYAYSNQPHAMHWNMARLAESLLPLLALEDGSADGSAEGREEAALASAREAIDAFLPQYEAARSAGLLRKLGLTTEHEGDAALAQDLLDRMAANASDFTLTFRRLADAVAGPLHDGPMRALFTDPGAYDAWAIEWRARLAMEPTSPHDRASAMRLANPIYIPRNHLVQEIIDAAVGDANFQPFEHLVDITNHPFDQRDGLDRYAAPAALSNVFTTPSAAPDTPALKHRYKQYRVILSEVCARAKRSRRSCGCSVRDCSVRYGTKRAQRATLVATRLPTAAGSASTGKLMCGRYFRGSDKQRLAEAFRLSRLADGLVLAPDYNVAPTSLQPVIRAARETGERELVLMRWGLVPYFAKSLADFKGFSTINTQAETIATKAVWRRPFERHRCLVPADGFYEWKTLSPKLKQPYAFAMRTGQPFAFAGVWDAWKQPDGDWLQSFSIITTDPNELTASVHSRMPVILKPTDYNRWLARDTPQQPPVDLLRPYDASAMTSHLVDPRVGNVRNNEPGLCTEFQCPPNSA